MKTNSDKTLITLMWILLIFFPPVGLIIMWLKQDEINFSKNKKIVVTAIFSVYTVILFIAVINQNHEDVASNNISNVQATYYSDSETASPDNEATQPNTEIKSSISTETQTELATQSETMAQNLQTTISAENTFVLNNSTKKFHKQTCSEVEKIKEENKSYYTGTADEVEDMGYSPCGKCNP